ncbi:MAG: Protein FdhE [Candidatus Erwinia impunctatus]|nr:Protein FdhE [Culicoides impunctatus]
MSIRIVPQDQLEKSEKRPAEWAPPLLFPRLKNLYTDRAQRLHHLAESHPMGDYLRFAALIARHQAPLLESYTLQVDLQEYLQISASTGLPPLDCRTFPRHSHWLVILRSLLTTLKPELSGVAQAAVASLEEATDAECETMATALLHQQFSDVSNDKAPFIWAALSVYWAQMAAQLPGKAQAEYGEHRQFCPVCASMPVASVVHMGMEHGGLRYLHCSLCESEWNIVRAKCSNCEQTGALHYWSLDSEHAAVKAESCDDCQSYLKVLYQEKDSNVDAIADDLASVMLDAHMEQEGFSRSGLNPFLFPGETD